MFAGWADGGLVTSHSAAHVHNSGWGGRTVNSETSSNLSVFCTALFGLATAPLSPAGVVFGGAAAGLAFPAVMDSLHRSHGKPRKVFADLQRKIERDWRDWVRTTDEYDDAQTNAAFAALNSVLPQLTPDPQIIMQANRDHARIADIVLGSTQVVAPHDYAERLANGSANPDAAQAETNGIVFRAVLVAALDSLIGNEANEKALGPWFQREVLGRLSEIGEHTEGISARLESLPDEVVEKLLSVLDARGELTRASDAGLGRETVFKLAKRLRPDEELNFDQAVTELTAAVEVAIDVARRGARGTDHDNDLVDAVLARVAARTRAGDFDGAAREANDGFATWKRYDLEDGKHR